MGGGTPLATPTIARAYLPLYSFGTPPAPSGRRIEVRGIVQGVGFRPWVYRVAQATAVTGRVRNHTSGVTIEAFGTVPALDAFIDGLAHEPHRPAAAVIDTMTTETIPFEPADRFQIVESDAGDAHRVSIPPDLATCPECLREIRDPADRRYRYAFTNCTNCGPRFTITASAPYDRHQDDDAPVPDVRDVPAGVRIGRGPAVPRAAECLPGLRPAAAAL